MEKGEKNGTERDYPSDYANVNAEKA